VPLEARNEPPTRTRATALALADAAVARLNHHVFLSLYMAGSVLLLMSLAPWSGPAVNRSLAALGCVCFFVGSYVQW
jgi:hypothetical protein